MLKTLLCTLAGMLLFPAPLPGQSSAPSERQVKAAFLYNFAKFFEWPPAALRETRPFVICVLGDEEATRQLRPLVGGKSIDIHPVEVHQLRAVEEGRGCHLLFITASATSQALRYLGTLADNSVLTVGEVPGFCNHGGVLNFWMEADHVRFEINLKAAERARLHPSSKLLRLARVVSDPDQNGGGF